MPIGWSPIFGHFAQNILGPKNNSFYFKHMRAHFGHFAQERASRRVNVMPAQFARARKRGPARRYVTMDRFPSK
jgi:hypothetical protein